MSSVYHHFDVTGQHEYINIVVSISIDGWSMHLVAPMDLIDIATKDLVTHFRLKFEARRLNNAIE